MTENPYPLDNIYTNQHKRWNEGYNQAIEDVVRHAKLNPGHLISAKRTEALRKKVSE